jgi:hypothetical protein
MSWKLLWAGSVWKMNRKKSNRFLVCNINQYFKLKWQSTWMDNSPREKNDNKDMKIILCSYSKIYKNQRHFF